MSNLMTPRRPIAPRRAASPPVVAGSIAIPTDTTATTATPLIGHSTGRYALELAACAAIAAALALTIVRVYH
jgi:hypothetical protein